MNGRMENGNELSSSSDHITVPKNSCGRIDNDLSFSEHNHEETSTSSNVPTSWKSNLSRASSGDDFNLAVAALKNSLEDIQDLLERHENILDAKM